MNLPNMFLTGILLIESKFPQMKKETLMSTIDMNDEKTVLKKVKRRILDDAAVKESEAKDTYFGGYRGNQSRFDENNRN